MTRYPKRVSLAAWNVNKQQNDEKPYLEMNDLMVCNEDGDFVKKKFSLVACTHLSDNMINRLPEWVEYHRLVGFDHFMIYIDSPNVDVYRKILEKYKQRHPNLVTFVPFFFINNRRSEFAGQGDCVSRLKGISKLAAVFDVDEFFCNLDNSTTLASIVMKSIDSDQSLAGVYGKSFLFGTITGEYPDSWKLFMENFILRLPPSAKLKRDKGIVVPDRVDYVANHNPTGGEHSKVANSLNEFRINHFRHPSLDGEWIKSQIIEDRSLQDGFSTQIKLELQNSGIALQ